MLINSTLCYIEQNGCYLMLFRNKKENDPCEGKWVGIGGKFEEGESADECLLREVWEETGLKLKEFTPCGIVHFKSNELPDEDMYLYTAHEFEGLLEADESGRVLKSDEICNEGDLRWVPKEQVTQLNLWEGDKYFLEPLIAGKTDINMLCRYEGDHIAEVIDYSN